MNDFVEKVNERSDEAFARAVELTRKSPSRMTCLINKKVAMAENSLFPTSISPSYSELDSYCDLSHNDSEERERERAATERSNSITNLIGMLDNIKKKPITVEGELDSLGNDSQIFKRLPAVKREIGHRTRPMSAGATARAKNRIQIMKTDSVERSAFNLRIAESQKRARTARRKLVANNDNMITNNILVMREFSIDVAIQRKELKDYQAKLRMSQVRSNNNRNREHKRERSWLQAYKQEIRWEYKKAEWHQGSIQLTTKSWLSLIACSQWFSQITKEFKRHQKVHKHVVAIETAKKVIGKQFAPWIREIRRRKARQYWKILRGYRPFLFLWLFVKKRRNSVATITQFLHFKRKPNLLRDRVLRFKSSAVIIQQLVRRSIGRKSLFQQLLLVQLGRLEDKLFNEKKRMMSGKVRGSLLEGNRRNKAHLREKELTDITIEDIHVPVQYKLEQIECFYKSQLVKYISDLQTWREQKAFHQLKSTMNDTMRVIGIQRKSLCYQGSGQPRPYIKMIWSELLIEKLLSAARVEMMSQLERDIENLKKQSIGKSRFVTDSTPVNVPANQARINIWSKSTKLQSVLDSQRIRGVPEF